MCPRREVVFLDALRWLVFLLLLLLLLLKSFLVLCGFPPSFWFELQVVLRLLFVFVSYVLVGLGAAVPLVEFCPFPCLG